jgi:hypothetical protein
MKTVDIKKGMRILMANGWEGTMKDNGRGVTRVAEIEGYYTETGSVYSYDIQAAQPMNDGIWHRIDFTEKEKKVKQMNKAMFGT